MMAKTGEMTFVPLGGAGEIGMNFSLYGYGGKWLAVDLGLTFAGESLPGIDLVLPDPAFAESCRRDLVGLVLTHAHEDHLGAVAYLWPRLGCPVYATPFAAALLTAKLIEAGLEEQVPLHIVAMGDRIDLTPFSVRYVRMTHSIPEPAALAIETPAGVVVHSGDWKIDPEPLIGQPVDAETLSDLGDRGVLALVCDSTNAMTPGHSGSEGSLAADLDRLMEGRHGRIAVTTFASNVARIQTIANVAARHDRRVVLVGRSLWRTVGAARQTGYLKGVPEFLTDRDAGYLPKDKVLLLCTGCQGESRGAMWRIASGEHSQVSFSPGDLVIFSSKIIPGNERVLGRLHNRLLETGVHVVTEKDAHVHVSGHPCRDELVQLYGWLRPQVLVPVHGEVRHMEAQAALARSSGISHVVAVRNGDVLRLAPGRAEKVGEVPVGRLVVDGDRLEPIDAPAVQERRRLMQAGIAVVSVVLRPAGGHDLTISAHGIPVPRAELEPRVREVTEAALRSLSKRAAGDDSVVREKVRIAVRRAIGALGGKRPLVDVQLLRYTLQSDDVAEEEEVLR